MQAENQTAQESLTNEQKPSENKSGLVYLVGSGVLIAGGIIVRQYMKNKQEEPLSISKSEEIVSETTEKVPGELIDN